jgi:hypothetical protein
MYFYEFYFWHLIPHPCDIRVHVPLLHDLHSDSDEVNVDVILNISSWVLAYLTGLHAELITQIYVQEVVKRVMQAKEWDSAKE